MSQIHTLELKGCMPEPLMSYLKALGIFRLVVQQQDSGARAWWQSDTFFLQSILDRDELVEFFLDRYQPSPIVSPWNGGSGFYPKDNSTALMKIRELESPRLQRWQKVVELSSQILDEAQKRETLPKKETKEWILAQCRARFPDDALEWLDASYILTRDGAKFPPLLGTGANDGRLEFSNHFMQNVILALGLDAKKEDVEIMRERLNAALFQEGFPQLVQKPTGFYNPGSVGGANAAAGFSGVSVTNPWDFVLMFEGILLFAGSVNRRLSSQAASKAVFPFTVENSASAYGTSAAVEYQDKSRAEFWAPLWNNPTCLRELIHLAAEGRAQLGRRQVSTGADFARAIAGLGTERGVAQFQRYGLLERNGRAYLAAPLGRFYVCPDQKHANRANVLFDLDRWLSGLRRTVSERGMILSAIERAIIEFCQQGQPYALQNILVAVGQAERWLARSSFRRTLRPINHLSEDWLCHADDGSAEFRLARAVATIQRVKIDGQTIVGPMRENFEPVSLDPRVEWKEASASFVWTAGAVLSNMLSVLQRRCLESRMHNHPHAPLKSDSGARLQDIAMFLYGELDVQRIADLALPLSFVRFSRQAAASPEQYTPYTLLSAYAVMKLTLLPDSFVCPELDVDETNICMEPLMLAMLKAGRIRDAYRVAYRRLKASGLQPVSAEPGVSDRSEQGRLLAAALLFPVDKKSYKELAKSALRNPSMD